MITARKTWDLGAVPSARAAWKTKDLSPDGEYGGGSSSSLGAQPAALTPLLTPGEGEAGNRPACIFYISFRMKLGI